MPNPHESQGINRLHKAMIGTAGLVTASLQRTWLELGTINADLSLTVDNYGMDFPTGSWSVSELYTAADPVETLSGTDSHGDTVSVDLTRPTILHPFQSGDRVLVALLHGGADPIVLCRVSVVGTVTP